MWTNREGLTLLIRRTGTEVTPSLVRRRKWFDGDEDKGGEADGKKPETPPADAPDPMTSIDAFIALLPDNLKAAGQLLVKELRDTRKEAADRRKELKKQQDDAAAAEAARLAEQGNFKQLYEQLKPQLDAAKQHEERVATLETKIQASNDKRIERLPAQFRSVVPTNYTPEQLSEWLDANEHLLVRTPAPNLDAGATGDKTPPAVKLTDEQKQMAKRAGMTEEEYAKAFQLQSANRPAATP